ncbi:intermembrane phospholipid transport protein YdbH family protein, partial [Caenispirillum bisanense]|uniref:intermembrane phospholipid transport protein YdbH family protein n=1 Tax=Caenispirillum bisanense TaxID=414052 RepID=UPI0031DA7F1C
ERVGLPAAASPAGPAALLAGFGGDGPLHLTLSSAAGGPPVATVTSLFDSDGSSALTTDGLALTGRRDQAAAANAAAGILRLGDGGFGGALRGMAATVEGVTVGATPLRASLADGTLTLTPEGLTATGTLEAEAATLVLGGPTAGRGRLAAEVRLTATPGLTGAVFADSGRLVLEDLRLAEGIAATGPVTLTLAAPQGPLLRLDRGVDGGPQVTLRGAFAAPAIDLTTPQGPARLAFAQVDVTAAVAGAGVPAVATVSGSGGSVRIAGVDLRDATLEAALAADGPAVTLAGRLDALPGESTEAAARSPLRPYRLTLQARPDDTAADALAVSGDLRDVGNTLVASARGSVSLTDGSGRLTVAVLRQVFDPQALRPEHLHGLLGTLAQGVSGAVAVDGSLAWTAAGVLRPNLKVLLQDVNLTQGFVGLTRVNGVVVLTGLSPLRTPPRQQVSVAAVDAGLPLLDAVATFEIERDTLHLEDASATLAGGTIRARPTAIPLSLDGGGATLDVHGMGLGPLVDLAGIDGLRARGQLAGTVPLRFEDGDVIIDNAVLRSTMSERLVYRPEEVPAALLGGGESVDLVLQALRDFRYQDLSLTVDGRASGQMTVRLHIAGSNPGFYDGYPVEFNLSISGELAKALQAGLSGYRVPDRIRERMEQFKVNP